MSYKDQNNRFTDALRSLYSEAEEYFEENNDLLLSLKRISVPYTEKAFLDEGGMKKIYSCKDLRSGRTIAMAELKDVTDHHKLNEFLREAKISAYLQHPNIIPVYEIGLNADEIPFFTMKLVRGQTLGDIIRGLKNSNPKIIEEYPLSKLIDIYEKVCDAIAYAHSKGVLHLDIKPDNISVSDYGEVLICDWGISEICPESFDNNDIIKEEFKSLLPLLRSDKVIRGTIPFISPEQINKDIAPLSPLSDIYSLGVLLYNLLTWDIPFKHTEQKDELIAVLKGDFPSPAEKHSDKHIPKSLNAICLKAMKFQPEDRYNSVKEMITEVQRFKQGYATEAEEAGLMELVSLLYKRNKTSCLSILAAFIIITTTILLSVKRMKQSELLAISERNHAVEARNKTMELINQLKSEQLKKLNMSAKAAEKYLQNVRNMLYFKNYTKADETIETVWELGSHLEEYQKYYGWYQVAKLNFNEALETLRPVSKPETIKCIQIAQTTLSIEIILELSDILEDEVKDKNLAGYLLSNSLDLQFPLEGKLKILQKEIAKNTSNKLNFKYQIQGDKLSLDISGTSARYPGSLNKFNITDLNISNSSIGRTGSINWSILESLNAANSEIKDIDLAPKLKRLDIKNCAIRDFSEIRNMKKLEYINIQGVKNFPMKYLVKLPNLNTVVLDKSQSFPAGTGKELIYK